MTILSMDTVSRANQTGFGTATGDPFGTETWVQVRGSMPSGVTSNELTCNSASGGTFNIFRLGSQSPGGVEVLARVNPADTSDIGIVLCYNSTTQFYYMVLSGGNLVIGKDNSGFSTLASVGFSYSAGGSNFYWLRGRCASGTLYLKGWASGSAEPTTWNVTFADSTFSSGGYGLGSDSSGATNTQFDGFVATDATISVVSESVTLSESITETGAASLTDSVTVSENVTQTGAASLTDSVSLAESVTQTGSAQLSEQVSLSESAAQTGIASNTDTVSLSEAVVLAALGILTLPADVVQVSEVVTLLGVAALTDNVQLLENVTGLGTIILASENVVLSESATASASVPAVVATVYAVGYGRDGYAVGEGA